MDQQSNPPQAATDAISWPLIETSDKEEPTQDEQASTRFFGNKGMQEQRKRLNSQERSRQIQRGPTPSLPAELSGDEASKPPKRDSSTTKSRSKTSSSTSQNTLAPSAPPLPNSEQPQNAHAEGRPPTHYLRLPHGELPKMQDPNNPLIVPAGSTTPAGYSSIRLWESGDLSQEAVGPPHTTHSPHNR
jgi:hypothetical protein